jgi:mannose/fructose/N-acetylgalactosamine-specific phosphotransferase system component IIC
VNAVLAVSLLGGLLSLEHRAELKFMVSQPVCSGLLTGLVLGSPAAGLFIGAMFQVMFLGFVPIRGEGVPDLPIGGVAASAYYIFSVQRLGGGPALEGIILFCALLFGLAISLLGYGLYRFWEKRTWTFFEIAMASAMAGRFRYAKAIHLMVLVFHFFYGFLVLLVFVPAGTAIIAFVAARVGVDPGGSMNALQYLVPFIGAGSLARLYFARTRAFWFGAGFLVTYLFFIVRS